MANFRLKILTSFLQIRLLQTKPSAKSTPLPKAAIHASTKSRKKEPKPKPKLNAETLLSSLGEHEKNVIAHLKSQEISETQVVTLVQRFPRILKFRIPTNLEPKLKFFNSYGFKGTSLFELIMSNPLILRRSLNAHLIPSLQFLKTQLGKENQGSLQTVIKRASWLMTMDIEKRLVPNIRLLEKEGLHMSTILKLFTSQPRTLLCSADRVEYGVKMVKKFGIKPDNTMFVHAFRLFLSMNESNMRKKMEAFKSVGWSEEDIVSTIVHQPLCFTCSEEKLRSSMDYFVNIMKVERQVVIASPKLVMYSMNKRVIPRCNVLMVLQQEKLMGKRTLTSLVNMTENEFIRKYIMKFIEKVPYLLDVYHGKLKVDTTGVNQ